MRIVVPTVQASARALLAASKLPAEERVNRFIAGVQQSLKAEGYSVTSDDVRRALPVRA